MFEFAPEWIKVAGNIHDYVLLIRSDRSMVSEDIQEPCRDIYLGERSTFRRDVVPLFRWREHARLLCELIEKLCRRHVWR